MKKTIIIISVMILMGLILNCPGVLSQETRTTPKITGSTGERNRDVFYGLDEKNAQLMIGQYFGQDEKSTQLMLSKHFSGESVSKSGNFTVDEGIRTLRISIQGSIRNQGSITVTIYSPNGELFKELEIDNSADVAWSQVLTIKEGSDEYTGEWTYGIEANEAEGEYNLSITTH